MKKLSGGGTGQIIPFKRHPTFYRALKKFTADADEIIDRLGELKSWGRFIERQASALAQGRAIDMPELQTIKCEATLGGQDEELLARCHEATKRFDPEDAYEGGDRNGNLKQGIIAERLGELIKSKANRGPENPENYGTTMMEHLLAEDFGLIALEAACYEVREAKPYVPDHSDLMPVLRVHQAKWIERFEAIDDIAEVSRRLVARIDALEAEVTAAAKAQADREQAAAIARAIEQARLDYEDAADALSAARDFGTQPDVEKAVVRLMECQNELARAEIAARLKSEGKN